MNKFDEGRYMFSCSNKRNDWLNRHFPNRQPYEQGFHPGQFKCGEYILKVMGDGYSVILSLRRP